MHKPKQYKNVLINILSKHVVLFITQEPFFNT